jgi:WD40 repeat protein
VTLGISRVGPALMIAACTLLGAGCKKEQESLVLVELKLASPDARATNLMSAKLMANPGPTRTFPLSMLSVDDAVVFGVYLSGDITGDVSIVAIAYPQGGDCIGFRGSNNVAMVTPGGTKTVAIAMRVDNVCPNDGGGTGGTTGAAGTGGAGGSISGAAGTGIAGTGIAGTGIAGTGIAGTSGTGRGGAAGTGTAGTGTAGTGTAGAGGTGRGGTGGGVGGMAGYPSLTGCRTFNHGTTGCPSTYVTGVAISPNGQLVATAGDDARVKIWTFDGRMLTPTTTSLPGFSGYGSGGVAFSPDGTRLAYTSNATVRTYTVAGWVTGPTLQDDGSGNSLRGVAFTPNGQRIVSVNAIGFAGGDVFVHTVGGSTLPALMAHVANEPYTLAVSPRAATDGSVGVAVGSYYNTTAMFTLGDSGFTGPTIIPTSVPPATGSRTVYSAAFSPDGSLFVNGEDYGVVRFFTYPLVTPPAPIGNSITFAGGDSVNDIAFSPNGMYVAVGGAFSRAQLSIYNASTHAEVDRTATAPAGNIRGLAFAPNGAAIIAGLDECGYVLVCGGN